MAHLPQARNFSGTFPLDEPGRCGPSQRLLLRFLLGILCGLWLVSPAAAAQDSVKQLGGSISGKVVEMSPTHVTVQQGEKTRPIETRDIVEVLYDGEPVELTTSRFSIASGHYRKAKAALKKLDLAALEGYIREDVEFYLALCEARLALEGAASISTAGSALYKFDREHKNSYHHFAACEVMGDLLLAAQKYAQAIKSYETLAGAPWDEYRMKAGVLVSRVLQAQGKHREALARLNEVEKLASTAQSEQAHRQALYARLGRAVSLGAQGQTSQAIELVQQVLADAPPHESELHARAYNTLGGCYLLLNQDKEALLAFLHVDLLYQASPDLHAEALHHLATLWEKLGKKDRAKQASVTLHDRYSTSRWAKTH